MIDFTVFEKKKKTETLPSNNQHCIEKKKNSPEIEHRLLLSWTWVFDHRSEEQTLFQSYFNP